MIVILVPFFLAAQLREAAWQQQSQSPGAHVPEATYRFSLNSTAVSDPRRGGPSERATRFDMSALLKCRFRGPASLVCRMSDARAVSFASTNLDPMLPAAPLAGSLERHPEYQLAEEAFEVTFTPQGIGKILVNRTVSPADLNMIRAVVNQLNVGANIAQRRPEAHFRHAEKSVIGKCETRYRVLAANDSEPAGPSPAARGPRALDARRPGPRSLLRRAAGERADEPWEDDYRLSGLESLGRRRGEALRLEKRRDLQQCSLRADYFFGSREGLRREPADFEARIVSSESAIYVSDEQFASYTHNELEIERQYGGGLVVYENYAVSLMSIDLAEAALMPASIVDPASASLYAYQYIDDDDESAELHRRARPSTARSS